ncbi:hypothetical protein BU17DRAFT_63822 [Hysterangium stoloniferum]|nr:hypothetical protein BU17DRAFT_63822 [Hysterangium stoloniferum]
MSLETPVVSHADRTTWAKQNPAANVQASREPTYKLTDAEKAMHKLAAELKKTGQVALNAAVSTYLLEQTENLNALAAAYNVKVKRIEDMNAIVHFFAKKVNSYLPVGYRKTLAELKVMAQDDPVQSFTKDDEKNLIIELIEYRALKKTSVRATNKAASRDILLTLDRVIDELDCLADRTGFSTFILGARNSVLERDPWELTQLFEQWLCKREKSNTMNIKRIEMNYTNYETTIVQAHGVKLIGFPLNQFVSENGFGCHNQSLTFIPRAAKHITRMAEEGAKELECVELVVDGDNGQPYLAMMWGWMIDAEVATGCWVATLPNMAL